MPTLVAVALLSLIPCENAPGPVSIVSRPAEVVTGEKERLYFQDEARPCPQKGPGVARPTWSTATP